MRSMSVGERRARLGVRHGLAPGCRFATATDAARALVGLHASDPTVPFLSCRARVLDFEPSQLAHELYETRVLTKHMAMRRTLFVFPEGTMSLAHSACSVAVARSQRKRLIKMVEDQSIASDGQGWLADAENDVLDFLASDGPATGAQISRSLRSIQARLSYGAGTKWSAQAPVSSRVFVQLAVDGRIRRGRPQAWTSSQHRWEVSDPPPPIPEDEAIAGLVEQWLYTFGPGTELDLKWWSGLGVTKIRAALAALDAVAVDLGGQVGFVLPDDLDATVEPVPWVAFLPSLDPTAMGWKERQWYLGGHEAELFDRNGNIGPTVWANGRIVGGWAQLPDGQVRFELLEDLGQELHDRAIDEAAALEQWFDGTVIKPRFPTPLDKRLRS